MALNRDLIVREVRAWSDNVTSLDNIPFNVNHKYKNEKDIYERLTVYVKQWVEGVFGFYTNEAGELVQIPDQKAEGAGADLLPEKGEFCKNWLQTAGKNMTALSNDWFEVALKGAKKGKNPLPRIKSEVLKDQDIQAVYNDARSDVVTTFFPAYRALRASFEKRWWFEWIFNHRQYVAERDALKVMTSLITSMTGYTKLELDREYENHRVIIKPEVIEPKRVAQPQAQPENVAEEQKVKQPEQPQEEKELKQEQPKVDLEEEPIGLIKGKTAVQRLERYKTGEGLKTIKSYLAGAVVNTDKPDTLVVNSVEKRLFDPMYESAELACAAYDECAGKKIKDVKTDLQEKFAETAQAMFEIAFKGLSSTFEMDSTTIVDGKQVVTTEKVSVFGINTLKDVIISAQHAADVMLQMATPVGFKKDVFGNFGKGYNILENTDKVRGFLKEVCGDTYSDKKIDRAIKLAKDEFNTLYRGEKPDMTYVYEIGYRPNPDRMAEEQKALGSIQHYVNKGAQEHAIIEDETLNNIINENVRKWKLMNKSLRGEGVVDWKEAKENWKKAEDLLNKKYPDYDPESKQKTVEDKRAERKVQKNVQDKLKLDLQEPKAKVAPPVESKPIELSVPQIKNK